MRFATTAFATRAKVRPPLLSRRPATPDDAADIAHLTNLAGDGLPRVLWQSLAAPGEDPMALGRARARRETGAYSYTRAEMALVDGVVAGAIIDYRLGPEPDPITDETPPIVAPLNALENHVRESRGESWYVNILAVKPFWQRLGIGRLLLEAADNRARAGGCGHVSLIVADANTGGRALYAAHGFREEARRRMVKQGHACAGENWLLMVKALS